MPQDQTQWVLTLEVMRDTVGLYEDLVRVPSPVRQGQHPVGPIAWDLGGEQQAEPVPPEPHCLMADLDAALIQQVLDVAKRQRVAP